MSSGAAAGDPPQAFWSSVGRHTRTVQGRQLADMIAASNSKRRTYAAAKQLVDMHDRAVGGPAAATFRKGAQLLKASEKRREAEMKEFLAQKREEEELLAKQGGRRAAPYVPWNPPPGAAGPDLGIPPQGPASQQPDQHAGAAATAAAGSSDAGSAPATAAAIAGPYAAMLDMGHQRNSTVPFSELLKQRQRQRSHKAAQRAATMTMASCSRYSYPKSKHPPLLQPVMRSPPAVAAALGAMDWATVRARVVPGDVGPPAGAATTPHRVLPFDVKLVPTLALTVQAGRPGEPRLVRGQLYTMDLSGRVSTLDVNTLEELQEDLDVVLDVLCGLPSAPAASTAAPVTVMKTPGRRRASCGEHNDLALLWNRRTVEGKLRAWFKRAFDDSSAVPQPSVVFQRYVRPLGAHPWLLRTVWRDCEESVAFELSSDAVADRDADVAWIASLASSPPASATRVGVSDVVVPEDTDHATVAAFVPRDEALPGAAVLPPIVTGAAGGRVLALPASAWPFPSVRGPLAACCSMAAALDGVSGAVGLMELAVDWLLDEDGTWWLLQLKGARVAEWKVGPAAAAAPSTRTREAGGGHKGAVRAGADAHAGGSRGTGADVPAADSGASSKQAPRRRRKRSTADDDQAALSSPAHATDVPPASSSPTTRATSSKTTQKGSSNNTGGRHAPKPPARGSPSAGATASTAVARAKPSTTAAAAAVRAEPSPTAAARRKSTRRYSRPHSGKHTPSSSGQRTPSAGAMRTPNAAARSSSSGKAKEEPPPAPDAEAKPKRAKPPRVLRKTMSTPAVSRDAGDDVASGAPPSLDAASASAAADAGAPVPTHKPRLLRKSRSSAQMRRAGGTGHQQAQAGPPPSPVRVSTGSPAPSRPAWTRRTPKPGSSEPSAQAFGAQAAVASFHGLSASLASPAAGVVLPSHVPGAASSPLAQVISTEAETLATAAAELLTDEGPVFARGSFGKFNTALESVLNSLDSRMQKMDPSTAAVAHLPPAPVPARKPLNADTESSAARHAPDAPPVEAAKAAPHRRSKAVSSTLTAPTASSVARTKRGSDNVRSAGAGGPTAAAAAAAPSSWSQPVRRRAAKSAEPPRGASSGAEGGSTKTVAAAAPGVAPTPAAAAPAAASAAPAPAQAPAPPAAPSASPRVAPVAPALAPPSFVLTTGTSPEKKPRPTSAQQERLARRLSEPRMRVSREQAAALRRKLRPGAPIKVAPEVAKHQREKIAQLAQPKSLKNVRIVPMANPDSTCQPTEGSAAAAEADVGAPLKSRFVTALVQPKPAGPAKTKRRNGAAVMAKARPDVCSAYTTPIVPMMRRKHKSKSRKPRDAGASRAAAGASPPAAPGVSRSPQQAASAPCEHPRMSPVAAVRSLSSTTPPPPTAAHASAEAPAPAPAPTSPAPPDAASRPTTAASAFTTGVDFCLFCGLDDAGCGC